MPFRRWQRPSFSSWPWQPSSRSCGSSIAAASVAPYFRLNFAVSGALGAFGGCLLAFNTHSISPEEFGFPLLVVLAAAVILGGRASVSGPILGTVILLALPEVIRPLHDQRLLLQGAVLVAVIIYLPN